MSRLAHLLFDEPTGPSVDDRAAFFASLSGRSKEAAWHPRLRADTISGAVMGAMPAYFVTRPDGADGRSSLQRQVANDEAAGRTGWLHEKERKLVDAAAAHPAVAALVGAALGGGVAHWASKGRLREPTHVPSKDVLGETAGIDLSKNASFPAQLEAALVSEHRSARVKIALLKLATLLDGYSEADLCALDAQYAEDVEKTAGVRSWLAERFARKAGSRLAEGAAGHAAGVAKATAVSEAASKAVPLPKTGVSEAAASAFRGGEGLTPASWKHSFRKPFEAASHGVQELGDTKVTDRLWDAPKAGATHLAKRFAGPAAYGVGGIVAAKALLGQGESREVTASVKEVESKELAKEVARRIMVRNALKPVALVAGGFYLGRKFPAGQPAQDPSAPSW